jgi:formamidopyrimidine-DNA glycosylase
VPELPEVEVVRRGLARWLLGARLGAVEVLHPRPVRRHEAGPADFAARLTGTTVRDVVRRGKFCWLELDSGEALLAHLGMSGQLLLQRPDAAPERHLRVRVALSGGPLDAAGEARELRFVDQRMFGGLAVVPLVATPDGGPGGRGGTVRHARGTSGDGQDDGQDDLWTPSAPLLPPQVAHIARDPLDPTLDEAALVRRWRLRRTGVKRALLDQTLVSGVGNIYADEALWRVRLHYARATDAMTGPAIRRLLGAVREVMTDALASGGTSFDALYVNVNGESGYFERSLAVYGQEGRSCPRCGTPIRRDAFMNRSSFTCPRCQPPPRSGRW